MYHQEVGSTALLTESAGQDWVAHFDLATWTMGEMLSSVIMSKSRVFQRERGPSFQCYPPNCCSSLAHYEEISP